MAARITPQAKHGRTGRYVKVRKNGEKAIDAASTMTVPLRSMPRIVRPQGVFRSLTPSLAAITPQYTESTLRGALYGSHVQQWELFDLMVDTWPTLAACQEELIEGVKRKKMIFEPYAEEDEKPTDSALERMKVVSCALHAMESDPAEEKNGLEETIVTILDGWFKGTVVLEIVWQMVDDPKVGTIKAPHCTYWVHPMSYAWSQEGILGLRTDAGANSMSYPTRPIQLVRFPENQFLIGIHKAKAGIALSGAVLRPLVWWWVASNYSADWLLNLAQVFGLPFRWVNYASATPSETVDAICTMLGNMGSAGWAAFPEGTTLELKDGGKSGDTTPQGDMLTRADEYARLLVLGQTMTGQTMTSGKGGQAFGRVEQDVKSDRLDAAASFVDEVINKQLIKYILLQNYGNTDEAPRVRFLEEEEAGYVEAQRDKLLTDAGLEIGVDFLRKKYGVPEPAEDEDTIGGEKPMPQPFGQRPPPFGNGQQPPAAAKPTDRTKQPAEEDRNVQARLKDLTTIEGDAVFATALEKFWNEIQTKENKQ